MHIIVYFKRNDFRNLFKTQMEFLSIPNLLFPKSVEEISNLFHTYVRDPLILGWEEKNRREDTYVLSKAQADMPIMTRPIMLFTPVPSATVAALATDYNVLSVNSGAVSPIEVRDLVILFLKEAVKKISDATIFQPIVNLQRTGDFDLAGREIDKALKSSPENDALIMEQINNLIMMEKWGSALNQLQDIVKKQPHNLRAKNMMARCLMYQGKVSEAADLLEDAKFLNPYNPERLVELGEALLELDRVAEAFENFKSASQLDRKNKAAIRGKSDCFVRGDDIEEAVKSLKNFTPIEKAAFFNNSAIFAVRNNKMEKALKLYDTSIRECKEVKPVVARLHFNKGLAYYKQQMLEPALAEFETSAKLDGRLRKARHNARIVAQMLGKEPIAEAMVDDMDEEDFTEDMENDFENVSTDD